MNPPTTPTLTAPFDLALAKLGWPAEIEGKPITNFMVMGDSYCCQGFWQGCEIYFNASTGAVRLSLNLQSPAYRLAVQRAHEELGEEVWYRPHMMDRWLPCRAKCLFDGWEIGGYCLARHLPYFQPQPESEKGGEKCATHSTQPLTDPLKREAPQSQSLSASNAAPETVQTASGLPQGPTGMFEDHRSPEFQQPPNAKTDTPETDAEESDANEWGNEGPNMAVSSTFARRLERERDAAAGDAERLREQNKAHAERRDRKEQEIRDSFRHLTDWAPLVAEAKEKMLNAAVDWTTDPPALQPGAWWQYASLYQKAQVVAMLSEIKALRATAKQFDHLLDAARAVVQADLQPLTEVDEQALTELEHQTLLFPLDETRKP